MGVEGKNLLVSQAYSNNLVPITTIDVANRLTGMIRLMRDIGLRQQGTIRRIYEAVFPSSNRHLFDKAVGHTFVANRPTHIFPDDVCSDNYTFININDFVPFTAIIDVLD